MFHEEYRTSRRRCGGNTLVPSGRRTDVRDKDERDRELRSSVDEQRPVDADVCRTGTALRTAKIGVSVSENVASEHAEPSRARSVFEMRLFRSATINRDGHAQLNHQSRLLFDTGVLPVLHDAFQHAAIDPVAAHPTIDRQRVAALLDVSQPRIENTLCRVGLESLCGDSDVAAFSRLLHANHK